MEQAWRAVAGVAEAHVNLVPETATINHTVDSQAHKKNASNDTA